jgi:hypothetical protein
MPQATLVALYGAKPKALAALLLECQRRISAVLGDRFRPYELQQIHATIVDLERKAESLFNSNLAKYRNRLEPMDLDGLLNFIHLSGQFPIHIQIGGFQNRDYPFTSRGQRPYERSFSLQGNKVVLVGWPIRGAPLARTAPSTLHLIHESRLYPNSLDELRKAFQSFNVLHKYHQVPTDVDNDFYFRIGLLEPSYPGISTEWKQSVEGGVRAFLSTVEPIIVEITVADIYVAAYEDPILPQHSTRVVSVNDPKVTPDFLWNFINE